jgi:hypothetical protein
MSAMIGAHWPTVNHFLDTLNLTDIRLLTGRLQTRREALTYRRSGFGFEDFEWPDAKANPDFPIFIQILGWISNS